MPSTESACPTPTQRTHFPFSTRPSLYDNPVFQVVGDDRIGSVSLPLYGCLTVNEALALASLYAAGEPPTRNHQIVMETCMFLRYRIFEIYGWEDDEIKAALTWPLIRLIHQLFESEVAGSDPFAALPMTGF